jgi:deoxyribodipyrimidine photo-lyase
VHWNRLYDPAVVARDVALETELNAAGLDCRSCNGALLHEPWEIRTAQDGPYRVFTPYWRACLARLAGTPAPSSVPRRMRAARHTPASVPLEALELLPRIRWGRAFESQWTPGETGAHARLDAFCRDALADYDEGRERPDRAASSRLSPHLHFGELSPRQCLVAVRNALLERPAAAPSADAFVRELGWREFAHHLLHHFPGTTNAPLDERFERFRWDRDDRVLEAWQRGRTGYPLVDAGMRELWSTGWMHNRARMVVASLLTKNLRHPWLAGARWFWDTLVDADLANNTLGWQWTAGCGADAAPFFRIFNPVLQAERHDPKRTYLRRWLPELARLPDAWIHRPWQAPPAMLDAAGVRLGETYPSPVVDLAASRAAALAAYAEVREPVAPRAGTAGVNRR